MKKLTALFLVLALIVSCAVPAMAAAVRQEDGLIVSRPDTLTDDPYTFLLTLVMPHVVPDTESAMGLIPLSEEELMALQVEVMTLLTELTAEEPDLEKANASYQALLAAIKPLLPDLIDTVSSLMGDAFAGLLALSDEELETALREAYIASNGTIAQFRDWDVLMEQADLDGIRAAFELLGDVVASEAYADALQEVFAVVFEKLEQLDVSDLLALMTGAMSGGLTNAEALPEWLSLDGFDISGLSALADEVETEAAQAALALMGPLVVDSENADASFDVAAFLSVYPPNYQLDGEAKTNNMPFDAVQWVPVRELAETRGCEVIWNKEDQSVTIVYDGNSAILYLGYAFAEIGGQQVDLTFVPMLYDDLTYVPLAAFNTEILAVLGCDFILYYDYKCNELAALTGAYEIIPEEEVVEGTIDALPGEVFAITFAHNFSTGYTYTADYDPNAFDVQEFIEVDVDDGLVGAPTQVTLFCHAIGEPGTYTIELSTTGPGADAESEVFAIVTITVQ